MTPKATSNWLGMHARFRPRAEALVQVGGGEAAARRLTYGEAYDRSLRWAGRLRAEGVGPGDRVAVLAHNTVETFVLLFACAELGAVLVPLNWRLTAPELRYQLERTAPRAVLGDSTFLGVLRSVRSTLPALPAPLLLDDDPAAAPAEGPGSGLDAPWVILFTSGSTGNPKGALLSHGQLHWNAVNTVLACDLTQADSTLTFTPLFHTGGLNCLSSPLLHRGGRVVVTRGFAAAEALRLIPGERITTLMGVPTIFQLMAEQPGFAAADLGSVRDALCGGAPLSVPLLRTYLARGIPLRQGFGLTEVGPNCFSMPAADAERKAGSVGMPIHHVDARLVRADGAECGADEPGELVLGGPAVCSGYWQDPDATAKALRGGWFHTGDVLSRDAEGFFWVRGRIKEMFISGGENVYPAEVEAALLQCGGVREAAVVGVPDARWGEVGAAWVTVDASAGDPAEVAARVLAELRDRVAKYKVPKTLRIEPALPRTASGKVDKPALRARLVSQ